METAASILVVEDVPLVAKSIEHILELEGYRVLTAGDGVEALAVLQSEPVDLILADIMMPRMNGYQLYQHVVENREWVAIPFIFLTARALDSDIRYAKEMGVDDYLTKPIEPADLVAVIRGKLLRARRMIRSHGQAFSEPNSPGDVLTLGKLRVDLDQHQVWFNGSQVRLSARELALLQCLALRPNKVVTLQELVQNTHNLEVDRTEAGSLLRPLVRSLRRKFGFSAGNMGCIEAVRGVGYRLVLPHN